jgi:hypothetical protein
MRERVWRGGPLTEPYDLRTAVKVAERALKDLIADIAEDDRARGIIGVQHASREEWQERFARMDKNAAERAKR